MTVILSGALAHGALLDVLGGIGHVDDPLHEDAGRDDVVGVDLAGLDQMLDLGHRDLARRSPSPD